MTRGGKIIGNQSAFLSKKSVTGWAFVLCCALITLASCQSDSAATLPSISTPTPPLTATPTSPPTATSFASVAADCQRTVDGMRELAWGLELPEHLMQEDPVKTGEEFDVNVYFSILDHLAVRPGYVLDYVYQYDFMGGRPVMYVRPEDQAPYLSYSEYYTSTMSGLTREERLEASWYGHMDHIQADGTEEGFFQFVALRIMGNQFYLYWHANYNDDAIVCDRERLEEIVARISEGDHEYVLSPELQQEALALDLEPRVEIGDDTVQVRVVTFSMWGGFTEEKHTIRRSFPHEVLEEDFETLVPYDCGIMF